MVYVYLPQQHLVETLPTEFTSRSVYKYRFAVSLCFVLYFLLDQRVVIFGIRLLLFIYGCLVSGGLCVYFTNIIECL